MAGIDLSQLFQGHNILYTVAVIVLSYFTYRGNTKTPAADTSSGHPVLDTIVGLVKKWLGFGTAVTVGSVNVHDDVAIGTLASTIKAKDPEAAKKLKDLL